MIMVFIETSIFTRRVKELMKRENKMKQELFEELLESVKEAKAIIKGEKEPSRIFIYDELDVKSIREQFGLSQSKFASLLGISLGTLRNWEQGRRKPQGPARVLLRVAQKHPEAILDTVHITENG
jgi:putative transcriptional regulator